MSTHPNDRHRTPERRNGLPQVVVDPALATYERTVIGYAADPMNAQTVAADIADIDPRHFSNAAHEFVFAEIKRHAGSVDVRIKVTAALIGANAPKALDALDRDIAGFLHDCVSEAACLTARELGHYANLMREAYRVRAGQSMLVRLGDALASGDTERMYASWAAFAEVIDGAPALASGQAPAYGDVAALLADEIPPPPRPDILHREDQIGLFYRGKVNVLFGDSEAGKTWVALAALVEVLANGGKAAFLDLDHNGMSEIVTRLLSLGAKPSDLSDPDRFRYCEPGDAAELEWFVSDIGGWQADVAVADSMGEILPMLGLSSNSPDDYTIGHRKVLARLAESGAAVIAIDHLPKDDAAREKGQTGTLAKKRAVNGVTLRVSVKDQFTPGHGGSANLVVNKDRPGGLRGHCPPGKNAPAGRFVMTDRGNNALSWRVTKPEPAITKAMAGVDQDLAELDRLVPGPRSKKDVQDRLGWGSDRAQRALSTWRGLRKQGIDPGGDLLKSA